MLIIFTQIDKISKNVIRQALFGLFGGISAILVVLTLGAGIACKMNMNRRTRGRLHKASSRTPSDCINNGHGDGEHDLFSVSSSSTSKPAEQPHQQQQLQQHQRSRFTRTSKQRSSQTASLLSTTSDEEAINVKRKKSKTSRSYSIKPLRSTETNHLLLIEEHQRQRQESVEEEEQQQIAKNSSNLKKAIFGVFFKETRKSSKQTETTTTPTIIEESDTLTNKNRELDSSSGGEQGSTSLSESMEDAYSAASSPKAPEEEESFAKTDATDAAAVVKFATLRANDTIKLDSINLFKYNTASKVAKATILKPCKQSSSQTIANTNVSSFKLNTPRLNNKQANKNVNLHEDCSQGKFYS